MEIVTWFLLSLAYVVGLIWSLVWFLVSGWVSTLLQIAVLIAVIYWLKYGWQRAPLRDLEAHTLVWPVFLELDSWP
jgi:hypothetical protein